MGDINIDFYNQIGNGYNQLHSFCDIFNLKNLINSKTCFAGAEGSSIDVLLTNKYRSFQNSSVLETGLSDHHHYFFKNALSKITTKENIL